MNIHNMRQRRFSGLFGFTGAMKPALLFSVLAIFFSGCSWLNEFFLFNKTGATIVVRYSEGVNYNMGNAVTRPKVYAIKSWENGVPKLGDTVSVFSRIENDTMRYVELPANTALVILEALNQDLSTDSQCKSMLSKIRYLEAITPNDKVFICRDTACFHDVAKINRSRAGIIIQ